MITTAQFEQSLDDKKPLPGMSVYLQSLWYDAVGDWQKAHSLVDSLGGKEAASVHAYLHRVEGDAGNANYWYNRTAKRTPDMSLKEEWQQLVNKFLQEQ